MAEKISSIQTVLEAHRINLASAKTFEEYRDHHVAYVEMLIERERARFAAENAESAFVWRTVNTDEVMTAQPENKNDNLP